MRQVSKVRAITNKSGKFYNKKLSALIRLK